MPHDLVIERARVIDGTGAPWFSGTVAVSDGQIQRIVRGDDHSLSGTTTLDATDRVVCPGFIDTHSHADLEFFSDGTLAPKTRQGVTTEVLGQDGFSLAPIYREGGAEEWQEHLSGLAGRVDVDWSWGSLADYLEAVEAAGTSPNVGTLVGHGTVRYEVLGMDDRAPVGDELDRMADLVTESLEDGALGLSTGLVYSPQNNASTAELAALAARCRPFGRPFVAHIRSEGRWIWEALDEFADVGARERVPVHLSHYKMAGPAQHGKAARSNRFIEAARERGVDFTAEQYPYTRGSTMLSAMLPPWVRAQGPQQLKEHLQDAEALDRIRRDIRDWRIEGWENVPGLIGWEGVTIASVGGEAEDSIEGRTIAALAANRNADPVDTVASVLLAADLEVNVLVDVMDEEDVRTIMANERVNIASDGLFGGRPHPRTYGTFPRVLGTYVREENVLTLEAAVRKMTSLPARVMGLTTKGVVRPGMDADLVVFDPHTVRSEATYDDPTRHPAGIDHVIVNGEFVVRDGEMTGQTPGTVLRGAA